MEHKIDEKQGFITDKIVQIYRDHFPNKDVYKKRSRDDMNNKVVDIVVNDGVSKTETVEHGDGTKIGFRFTEDPLEQEIKDGLGMSSSRSSPSGDSRPKRDVNTGGRHNGDDKERRRDDEEYRRRRRGGRSSGKSMDLIDVNSDGSITMMPPFTKEQAEYETHTPHSYQCKDCVHYVEGGGCTLVQGDIDPEAHCERFFAEVGMFGSQFSDPVLNLKLWGEDYSMAMRDIKEFVEEVEEEMENK